MVEFIYSTNQSTARSLLSLGGHHAVIWLAKDRVKEMLDSQSHRRRARKRPAPIKFTLAPDQSARLSRLSSQRHTSDGLLAKSFTLEMIQYLDSEAGAARTSDEVERNASVARVLTTMSITLDILTTKAGDAPGSEDEVKLLQVLQKELAVLMKALMPC